MTSYDHLLLRMSHVGSGGGNAAVLASATRSVMSTSSTTAKSASSSAKNSSGGHLKDGVIDLAAGTLGGIANVYTGQVSVFWGDFMGLL